MNLINILLIVSVVTIIIILRTTETFDHTVDCMKRDYGKEHPYTKNDIFDGVSLYKQYNTGGNSQLASVFYTPENIPNSLKNRPNSNNNIGASNEGAPVFSDMSVGVNKTKCRACKYEADLKACDKNVAIMDSDYCPKILTCSGATPMGTSVSYKRPQHMDDGVLTEIAQLELISVRTNQQSEYTKQKTKDCCDLLNSDNNIMREKFKAFLVLYLALKKEEMDQSINEHNMGANMELNEMNNIHWEKINQFLQNAENSNLFSFPPNSNTNDRFYIMLKLVDKYTECSNPAFRKC
jgi:hypothetical protein